jgi:hypothetical protein
MLERPLAVRNLRILGGAHFRGHFRFVPEKRLGGLPRPQFPIATRFRDAAVLIKNGNA